MPCCVFSPSYQSIASKYKAAGTPVWHWGFDNFSAGTNSYDCDGPFLLDANSQYWWGSGSLSPGFGMPGSILRRPGPNGHGGESIQPSELGAWMTASEYETGDISTSSFSVAFWVKPDYIGVDDKPIVGHTRTNDWLGTAGWAVWLYSNDLGLYAWSAANGALYHNVNPGMSAGTWYHVAIVNRNTQTGSTYGHGLLETWIYVNKVQIRYEYTVAASAPWTFTDSDSRLQVNRFGTYPTSYYSAHGIDDLWVIGKQIDTTELAELYSVMG